MEQGWHISFFHDPDPWKFQTFNSLDPDPQKYADLYLYPNGKQSIKTVYLNHELINKVNRSEKLVKLKKFNICDPDSIDWTDPHQTELDPKQLLYDF